MAPGSGANTLSLMGGQHASFLMQPTPHVPVTAGITLSAGSVGASATPSRVFKGMKMAGRLGGKRVTQVGLTVQSVVPEQNLLLVKGAVPGPKNGLVEVREEVRRGSA